MNEKFYIDAHRTDRDHQDLWERVYFDGTRQPYTDPELTDTSWDRLEALPGWATWDTQQAIKYIEDNVTDLASAKKVLIAMTKMLIALRDFNMPHLDKDRK